MHPTVKGKKGISGEDYFDLGGLLGVSFTNI